jgi:hypothetical protein
VLAALAVCAGSTETRADEYWPIYPPYPYRAGHYPKADWYHDMPPYVALKPSFYRKRYFMMARERNRYRYMPHIFSGPSADEGIDYGPDVTFDYEKLTSTNGDGDMPKR